MVGGVRPAAGKVTCLPPPAGRPGEWLRFWRLPPEAVRFTAEGRVELPLLGYVRLRLQRAWAPDAAHMAGLFGLPPEAVLEVGNGWVLVPVPNMAMAVREGQVMLWCLDFVPEVVDLEEMVLGTRHRQWHLFYLETQRYRRRAGYSATEEGELLYGGPVQGRIPYGCRVVLPTRLLSPEEAWQLAAAPLAPLPEEGWLAAPAAPLGGEEAAPEGGWRQLEEALLAPAGEGSGGEAAVEEPAAPPVGREAGAPGDGEVRAPPRRRREGISPLQRAAGAIVRAAASLVLRPEEPPEEGEDLIDYLQVTGGVRTLLWALAERGLPVRGVPAVWVRGGEAGMVVELRREVEEARVTAAVEGVVRPLALGGVKVRKVGMRLWDLAVASLPRPRPEGATVRVALVPVGRRAGEREGVWVVLADLGAPGGLLLEAAPLEEERFVAWWTMAAALALPGLEVWAQEGTPAVGAARRRYGTVEAMVDALYDEVVGRFEEGRSEVPVLAVTRRPAERDREVLVTLANRGPEVGCYVVVLGEAAGSGFPAWVRVVDGEIEAEIAGGRARLLLPAVEAAVPMAGEEAPAAGRQDMAGAGREEAGEASPQAAAPEGTPSLEEGLAPADQEVEEEMTALGAAEGIEEQEEEEEEEEEEAMAEGPAGGRGVASLGPVVEPLAVSVLGPLRTSLRLERQAARELLALLVLREGEIRREEAAALLEEGRPGGMGPTYALNRLKLAVKALRRACEEAGLPRDVCQVLRTGQVVLLREWVRCDLWEALELARGVAAGTAGPEAAWRLEELVRGPLLEGELFSWVEQETARVDRYLRGLLLRAARKLAAEGQQGEAAALAQTARRLDPLDEVALRLELECLLAAGKTLQARTTYRAFLREMRRLLEDEGVVPEEETLELVRRLGLE